MFWGPLKGSLGLISLHLEVELEELGGGLLSTHAVTVFGVVGTAPAHPMSSACFPK